MSTKLKPEAIKPGLRVKINWNYYKGEKNPYFLVPGKVIRKLRKNWLVEVDRGIGETQNASIPYEAMTIDIGWTKDGRPLLATSEDKQYMFSKEHNDYLQSIMVDWGNPKEATA